MPNSPTKPVIIVTRKLPDVVETRMRELFDARLNVDDAPFTQAQLVEAARSPTCWCRPSPTASTAVISRPARS